MIESCPAELTSFFVFSKLRQNVWDKSEVTVSDYKSLNLTTIFYIVVSDMSQAFCLSLRSTKKGVNSAGHVCMLQSFVELQYTAEIIECI